MIEKNRHSNLLEQEEYKYSLQDVAQPNLYRDIYPYSEVPYTTFNHRRVPHDMPEQVWITDTTFRDGQQSRAPYTAKQIVDVYKMLARLGGPKGIIRQSEFFVYTKKDRDALEQCMALGYKFPEITTWIRAKKEDFELVRDIGIKESGILVSCSDYHIFKKLNMTRKQAFDHYLGVVKDGFVVPIVNELTKLSKETGIPVKIRMCDTMGYGVPFPGVAPPRSVPGLIYGLHHYSDVTSEMLEWHGHNDFYMGVANAVSAWLYGASGVNCSLLGIGERTGNVPLEAMVMQYASLQGTMDGMDPTVITEIAEYFKKELKYDIPMTPFVGDAFNLTRAGIHADGMMKDAEIYNIFDTEKILNRPAAVSISNTSGLAGIAYWLNMRYGLKGEKQLTKSDWLVQEMKARVDAMYADGRTTVMGEEELESLVSELKGDARSKLNWFELQ